MPALNINDLNNGRKDLDHIAEVATSGNVTATDRLGKVKPTVKGAINSLKAFNARGAFVGDVDYAMKDVYTSGGIAYVAVSDHVSSTVAADLAAGKVTVHQGATREELAAPDGAMQLGFEQDGEGAVPVTVGDVLRAHVNGAQFGVDHTGGIDSSIKFAKATAAARDHGVALNVMNGEYRVEDASAFPDNSNNVPRFNVNMGPGVKFKGTIQPGNWYSVPCLGHSQGNGYNLITGSYEFSEPDMAFEDPGAAGTYPFGHATRIIEVIPDVNFRGNADALFAHAIGKTGVNAAIGAINMVTRLEAGFLGDGNGFEVDIDNHAADRKGLGGVISGIGSKTCEAGLKVTRGDTTSNWHYGVHVSRAKHGMYIDLYDEPNPIAGLFITGMSKDLLQLRPKDDANPTDAATFLTNAGGNVVKVRTNKNGSIDSSSYLKATGDVIVDNGNLGVMIGTASGPLPVSAVACIAADAGGYGTFNDLIIQPRTGVGAVGSVRFYAGDTPTEQWRFQTNDSFRPGTDNTLSIGGASNRVSVVYAGTGTINTSDRNAKQQVQDADATVLRAWAKVQYQQFKYNDAVAEKGDGARWHFGVIAQQVKAAFESEGLDPFAYGLLCFDVWPDEYEEWPDQFEEIPATYSALRDVLGNPIEIAPAGKKLVRPAGRRLVRAAGNRYGVRYEEALVLECAYLRSRLGA